ncbi:ABC transporter [Streptomyces spiroverticillatus]|uniref:ABC transporter n=1 Tax=Streptomyces finlayi TaxID=67296 RepID=A0A919C9I8_9ACTN|nr:FtsX-like permease family protein [Streptomyces finlayi]GHA08883.1 ABC transporter [Streptomyces spiroverticillatus]GHC91728.1 ABC transporter [Streptomyces finlayi]
MFRTALRNVLAHKARLLMTAFAVLLGVTFITGSLAYGDSQQQAAVDRAAAGYDRIDLSVAPDSDPANGSPLATLDDRTAAALAKIDGVRAAAGRVDGFAAVADRKGNLLGTGDFRKGGNFAPNAEGTDPAYQFGAGTGPTRKDEIALDEASATKAGYRVGDTVRVGTGQGAASYKITGTFRTDASKLSPGGSLTLFANATAQRLFLRPGKYTEIEITAADGTDALALADRVDAALPDHTSAITGAQLAQLKARLAASDSGTMSQIMTGFAAVALFVATFLISNTFTMLVSRRTRELALLRAVGATREQVRRILLTEAVLVGVLASVAGIVAGAGVTSLLQKLFATPAAPAAPVVLTPTTLIVSVLVGTVLPVIAAWLPIRRAMAIPPVAALGAAEQSAPEPANSLRTRISVALTVAGTATAAIAALTGSADARTVIGIGAGLAMIGAIGLIPVLSRPFVTLLRPLLLRVNPVHGDLAARNTVRDPRRTGATAAALAIALALASGLSVLGASATQYMERATKESFTADFVVNSPGGANRLTPATAEPLKKLPGVTYSPLNQSTQYQLGGTSSVLTGVDPATIGKLLKYDIVSGSLDSLARGQIAVADFKAEQTGWKVGQTLPLERNGKKGEVTVGAVYRADEQNDLMPSITAPDSLVARYDSAPSTNAILVSPEGGASARADVVRALGDNPALAVLDKDTIAAEDTSGIADQLNIFYALLSMALVIAALGIANTLAMSVLERGKEIGTLRAIGLDRVGVTRMIRLEALLVGLLGAAVGTVMGVFLGWAMGRTLQANVAGFELVLPWGRLALGIALAVTGALLASLWPARRAARVDIPAATAAQ